MTDTKVYLDNQSNLELTNARLKSQTLLRDDSAVRSTILDWVEPAAVDRTITVPDPTVDTEVVLAATPQTLSNKKYTGPSVAADDMVNKAYVDAAAAGGTTATSAPGGGVKGVATYDENFGLTIFGGAAGIARVKVDGVTAGFDGSGNLQALATAVPVATSAAGGGTLGRTTADTLQGMEILAGIVRPRVDGATIVINGSGQLQGIGASGATGLVSNGIPLTGDIPAVTPPTDITIGSDIDALEFPKGSTTGTKFEWTVPDDYASGDIEVLLVYRMDSASGSNQIRLSSQAVIVDATNGVIDSASYPETQFNFATPTTTNIVRQLFMSIASGDFNSGDQIQVRLKRFGASGSDLHPGDLQAVVFEMRYNSVIDSRLAISYVELFSDAAGENPTTDSVIGSDVDVTVFDDAADSAVKFQITVPDHWDEVTDASVRCVYAMSSAASLQTVRLETSAEVVDIAIGTITPVAAQNYDFSPPNDTNPHRTTVIRDIDASALRRGDVLKIKLARRVGVGSNHPGDFQLVGLTVTFGVVGAGAVVGVLISEQYLTQPTFGNVSGPGVSADTDYVDLVEFETFDRLSSTTPAGSIRAAYEGRLSSAQTQVTAIRLNLRGVGASPQYRLRVYAEGTGQVYDSGVQPAPGATTQISLTAVDLSAQPTTQKRYFVELQATIDAGEAVLVSRPHTRQE